MHNFVLAYKSERLSRPTKQSAQAWVETVHKMHENAFIYVHSWGLGRRPTVDEMSEVLDAHGLRINPGLGVVVK